MKRIELEHLIRAAAAITDQYEIVVIGSQSILGSMPHPPEILLQSMEADFYPLHHPERADLIDGAIGELSPFHNLFGYYAQGVGPETAKLPSGWQERLVKIQNTNTDLKIGLCLELHDLAASKLAAGRPKDWDYVQVLISENIVDKKVLCGRVQTLPIDVIQKDHLMRWVGAQHAESENTTIASAVRFSRDDGPSP